MKPAIVVLFLVALVPGFAAAQAAIKFKPLPANVLSQPGVEYTAELRNRAFSGTVRAGDTTWQCGKGLCRARLTGTQAAGAACSALVAQTGQVLRFGSSSSALDTKRLAVCNGTAPSLATAPMAPPTQVTPRMRASASAPSSPAQPQLRPGAANQLQKAPLSASVLANRQRFAELGNLRARAEAEARQQREADARTRRDAESQAWERRRLALGYTHRRNAGRDCDDTRSNVNPLAAETCDHLDNDCNGLVDEGQTLAFFLDADGDGKGDPAQRIEACASDQQRAATEGRWLSLTGNDCDDTDPNRWRDCE